MIIPTSALPSKGYGTLLSSIEIKPLTYREMIEYSSNAPRDPYLRKIWDIEKLIKRISGWEQLNCFDVDSLIFSTKYISVSSIDKFSLYLDNGKSYELPLSSVKFDNLDLDTTNIKFIKLGSIQLPFNICNVVTYLNTITELSNNYNIKIASLSAILGYNKFTNTEVPLLISNATYDEILLLDSLYSKIFETVKPIEVEGAVVDINNSITDIFRFLKANKSLDKNKIVLDERLS
jgi:hypothetical protein